MSILDIIEAQKQRTQEQLSRGGGPRSSAKFWRPEAGENHVRIMPQWSEENGGQFWREVSQHWNVSPDQKGPILCPRETQDLEGECPICELVAALRADKTNVEGQKLARDIRAKRTYLLNVIVNSDPQYTAADVADWAQSRPDDDCPFEVGDPKIQIYACPVTLFDQILGIMTSSKQDITDLKTGREIMIKKIPNPDRIKTRYEIYPSLVESDTGLTDPDLPDLSKVGFTLQYDKMVELLGQGRAAQFGITPTPSLPASAPAPSVSDDDLESQMKAALST